MKKIILDIINKHPKHYVKIIKNNASIMNWINQNKVIETSNFSQLIWHILNDDSGVCEYGQQKKFHGINNGYKNCGPARNCRCTKEQVSNTVRLVKSKISDSEKQASNEKREKTNLERYGVKNIGQSDIAKTNHKLFYMSVDNINNSVNKFKNTMTERYGADNPQKVKSIKEKTESTIFEKYGTTNALKIESTIEASKKSRTRLKNEGLYLQIGYHKFANFIRTSFNFELITSFEEYHGIHQKNAYSYKFKCLTCDTITDKKFYHSRGLNCEICNPTTAKFKSNEEQEVFDFISKELGILNGKQNDRIIINPYELDMIFPDQKIAIEYCGLFWHCELSSGRHKKYHKTKLELANEKGWKLITIFSDEWNKKCSIVKNRLRHLFNKSIERHYARNLTVIDVSTVDANKFLNTYHIQGYAVSKFRYGLITDNNELVAIMTFSTGRKALNSKDEYELVRYSTNGSSVVGGASKLLKHFIKNKNPKQIATYADLRWSDGNLYETLNFSKHGNAQPGYWYVDHYTTRLHRYNFTKKKLIKNGADEKNTEWEIMKELGYDRIWDCGHQKYYIVFQ